MPSDAFDSIERRYFETHDRAAFERRQRRTSDLLDETQALMQSLPGNLQPRLQRSIIVMMADTRMGDHSPTAPSYSPLSQQDHNSTDEDDEQAIKQLLARGLHVIADMNLLLPREETIEDGHWSKSYLAVLPDFQELLAGQSLSRTATLSRYLDFARLTNEDIYSLPLEHQEELRKQQLADLNRTLQDEMSAPLPAPATTAHVHASNPLMDEPMTVVPGEKITASSSRPSTASPADEIKHVRAILNMLGARSKSILDQLSTIVSASSQDYSEDQLSAIDYLLSTMSDAAIARCLCDCGARDPGHASRKQLLQQVKQIRRYVTDSDKLQMFIEHLVTTTESMEAEEKNNKEKNNKGKEVVLETAPTYDNDELYVATPQKPRVRQSFEMPAGPPASSAPKLPWASLRPSGSTFPSSSGSTASLPSGLTFPSSSGPTLLSLSGSAFQSSSGPGLPSQALSATQAGPSSGNDHPPTNYQLREVAREQFAFNVPPPALPETQAKLIEQILDHALTVYKQQATCTDPHRYFAAMVPLASRKVTNGRRKLFQLYATAKKESRGSPYSDKATLVLSILEHLSTQAIARAGNLFDCQPHGISLDLNLSTTLQDLSLPWGSSDLDTMVYEPSIAGLEFTHAWYSDSIVNNILLTQSSRSQTGIQLWLPSQSGNWTSLAGAEIKAVIHKIDLARKYIVDNGWPEEGLTPQLDATWWEENDLKPMHAKLAEDHDEERFMYWSTIEHFLEDLEGLSSSSGSKAVGMLFTTSHWIAFDITPKLEGDRVGLVRVFNSWDSGDSKSRTRATHGETIARGIAEIINRRPGCGWQQSSWDYQEGPCTKQRDAWACGVFATEATITLCSGQDPQDQSGLPQQQCDDLRETIRLRHLRALWASTNQDANQDQVMLDTPYPEAPTEDVSDDTARREARIKAREEEETDRQVAEALQQARYEEAMQRGDTAVIREIENTRSFANLDANMGYDSDNEPQLDGSPDAEGVDDDD